MVVLALTRGEIRPSLIRETTRPVVEVSARWTRPTSAGTAWATRTAGTAGTATARSAVLCNVQTERTTTHFPTMNLLYGLGGMLLLCETHESETPGSTRFPIGRDVHVNHFTNFSEQLAKLLIGRGEVQVTYKDLV